MFARDVPAAGFLKPAAPLCGIGRQLRVLFWRAFLNIARDKMLCRVRLAQSIFFGVVVGLIFLQMGYDQVSFGHIDVLRP